MDCADLLIDIDILKMVKMSLALALQMTVKSLNSRLLPPGLFVF